MRRKTGTTRSTEATAEAEARVADGMRAGQPLPEATRGFFEQRFGRSFGDVQIHSGSDAAASAHAVNAKAFTYGRNIVFGEGQYDPQSRSGMQLLAHELTHVLQQTDSVHDRTIRRVTHPPARTDCASLEDYIRLVVVNQESPQKVTVFWNYSGDTETGICSTGKGTCCIDSVTPADDDLVGAQRAGSTTSGSHWTPIGVKPVQGITNLGPDDERRYWTEFDSPRSIALHAYNRVDGTPLSHGCVRMNVDLARTIYCGSIAGKTQVEVRGFARPQCSNTNLQNEWTLDGVSPIPRCSARSGLSPEVERLQRISPSQMNQAVIADFRMNLGRATTSAAARAAAEQAGRDLWTSSHGTTSGSTVTVDDRPLYWTRNFIVRELQEWNPDFTLRSSTRASIIEAFEQSSRGLSVTAFRAVEEGVRKILITGFDPFGMDDTLGREGAMWGLTVGNPSGAVVLALDGQTIPATNCSAMVQGAVFPVRYADFDRGVVENYVRNFISGGNTVDMIMTISRNRDDGIYELERFAARARGSHSDNENRSSSQADFNRSMRRIHPGSRRADEFRESTLPRSGMQSPPWVVQDNSYAGSLPGGTLIDETTHPSPPANAISVRGSGGDFLSNEIFYRVSMLQLNQGTAIPMGHLHVPAGTQAEYETIVNTVRQIITEALNNSLCAMPTSPAATPG